MIGTLLAILGGWLLTRRLGSAWWFLPAGLAVGYSSALAVNIPLHWIAERTPPQTISAVIAGSFWYTLAAVFSALLYRWRAASVKR